MNLHVELFEKLDRLEVLPAAEAVRLPLPFLAAVVEVEHRGHGVDPETVDVVAIEPEEAARDQVIRDLVASVVEDHRAPVRVFALTGICMLVEGGAVKLPEAVGIAGEVGRHPVNDHSHTGPVESVDQRHEGLRRTEPARRGEQADRLVAPTGGERML